MTKHFKKWSHKEKVEEAMLLEALNNLANNLASASLGSGLYKVRVARQGQGKREGFRTLIVYSANDRAVFVYGFKKSEKENISKDELEYWREFANTLLTFNKNDLKKALNAGLLIKLEENRHA